MVKLQAHEIKGKQLIQKVYTRRDTCQVNTPKEQRYNQKSMNYLHKRLSPQIDFIAAQFSDANTPKEQRYLVDTIKNRYQPQIRHVELHVSTERYTLSVVYRLQPTFINFVAMMLMSDKKSCLVGQTTNKNLIQYLLQNLFQ